jgi:hypothetical protein
MRQTLAVTPIPVNNQTAVLLIGIFMNPSMFGGGGSPATIVLWPVKATTRHATTKSSCPGLVCQINNYPCLDGALRPVVEAAGDDSTISPA